MPNNKQTSVIRIYGGTPSGDPTVNPISEPTNQGVSETLVVGTYRRSFRAPKKGGHFCLQHFVDSAAGAASAATVWYSNIPDPSLASDADWTQDGTIGSIDLTVTGSKMFNVGNIFPEWIMVKEVIAVSSGTVRCFVRTEGTSISGL